MQSNKDNLENFENMSEINPYLPVDACNKFFFFFH